MLDDFAIPVSGSNFYIKAGLIKSYIY